jgi:hypothetical protein
MSDSIDLEPIIKLQGQLGVQRQLVEQITASIVPTLSTFDIKKEFKGIIGGLAQEIRGVTADAAKAGYATEGAAAIAGIMLDAFTSIDVTIKKYEMWASDSIIADSTLISTSRQIADKIQGDAKEAHSKIEAFRRIQAQESPTDRPRNIGDHPESIRRQRQLTSALDEAGEEIEE